MSISPAHSEAARANGARSHGPVSAEGKSRSSQNATKHSLFSATPLLSPEDQAAFHELEDAFIEEYAPDSPTEHRYLREMIDAEWRLQRVRAHLAAIQQARMLAICSSPTMDDAAEAFRLLSSEGSSLALLSRYETQFRRQFDKSLQMLLDLRVRLYTDEDRIQRTLTQEQIRSIHAFVNAPCPSPSPAIFAARPASQPSTPGPQPVPPAAAAAAASSAPNTGLQNEPTPPPFQPQRRFNIFKKRGKSRPQAPINAHQQN